MKKYFFITLFLLNNFNILKATNLFWVNGSGNWTDNTHWSNTSGGPSCFCSPTNNDNVFFDSYSFNSFGQIVIIDSIAKCKDMSWVGVINSPVLNGTANLNIYGSMIMSGNMSINFSGLINFKAITPNNQIITAGNILNSDMNFNGNGGSWILMDSLLNSNGMIKLSEGEFNTNSQYVKIERLSYTSDSSFHLILGASLIEVSGENVPGFFAVEFIANNLIVDAGTSIIRLTGLNASFKSYSSQIFYDVEFTNQSKQANGELTGAFAVDTNYFHNIFFASNSYSHGPMMVNNITISGGRHYYFFDFHLIGTIISNSSCNNPNVLVGRIIKSSGTVILNYVRIRDSKASGGATFIANNSVDQGFNSGWIINPPAMQTLYWVGDSGDWNDNNHWSLTSGGASGNCIPSRFDNVVFDANSFTHIGDTVTVNTSLNGISGNGLDNYCHSMLWLNISFSPVLWLDRIMVHGSFMLSKNMKLIGYRNVYFNPISPFNSLLSAGHTLGDVGIYLTSRDFILMDSLVTNNLIQQGGNFNTNGQFIKTEALEFNFTDTLRLSKSNIEITGSNNGNSIGDLIIKKVKVLDPGTSLIKFTGYNSRLEIDSQALYDIEFNNTLNYGNINTNYNGGVTNNYTGFNNITFKGDGRIAGNHIIHNLHLTEGKKYIFYNGDTIKFTGKINANGTTGSLIKMHSGGIASFTNSFNTICVDYTEIKNIQTFGSAPFFAGVNSIDSGNTNGWNFSSCDITDVNNNSFSISKCRVLPTLVQDNFKILFNDYYSPNVVIFNNMGQCIFKKSYTHISEIDLNAVNFITGMYLINISIEKDNLAFSERIVKK